MKNFSTILLIFLINSIAWGYAIVKAESSPGYAVNPEARTFILDSSGRMTLTIKELRTGAVRLERLGLLFLVEMQKIKSDVAGAAKPSLVDQRPEGPFCADAPEYEVSFYISGISKPVYRTAQCHEFILKGNEGKRTIDLALAFLKM